MQWRIGTQAAMAALGVALALASAPGTAHGVAASGATELVGSFSILPGTCGSDSSTVGSFLQIEVAGTPIPNIGSACTEQGGLFSPLSQGTHGLVTGDYQPDPVPTFDVLGNSEASAIIRPVRVLANTLGLATTCADQSTAPTPTGSCEPGQSGFAAPTLDEVPAGHGACASSTTGDCLYGDLRSLGLTWAGFRLKTPPSTLLHSPWASLNAPSTCVNATGCSTVGVSADPSTGMSTCTSPSTPGSCVLFGTIDPTTGRYTLALSTGLSLSILPDAVLHLVLRGVFTPAPSHPTGVPALGRGGASSGSTGPGSQPTGTTGTGGGGTGTGTSTTPATGNATTTPAPSGDDPSQAQSLNGTMTLSPSSCSGSTPVGSYLTIVYDPVTEGNPNSSCDGGAYTLLQPGTSGLAFGAFTPDPSPTFDADHNSLAGAIDAPAMFKGFGLGLSTSPDDVQDAPGGPAVFSPPVVIVQGTNLVADLRSLNVTYDGPPNATCAQSSGVGCWQEGSRIATGTFDPSTGTVTLDWYSSQDFTGGSGEVDFRLSGIFTGTFGPADPALLASLASSDYQVTGSSVESETLPGSTSATQPGGPGALSATTTTSPSSAAGIPTKRDVVTIREAGATPARSRSGSVVVPIGLALFGAVMMVALLRFGRSGRRQEHPTPQEIS